MGVKYAPPPFSLCHGWGGRALPDHMRGVIPPYFICALCRGVHFVFHGGAIVGMCNTILRLCNAGVMLPCGPNLAPFQKFSPCRALETPKKARYAAILHRPGAVLFLWLAKAKVGVFFLWRWGGRVKTILEDIFHPKGVFFSTPNEGTRWASFSYGHLTKTSIWVRFFLHLIDDGGLMSTTSTTNKHAFANDIVPNTFASCDHVLCVHFSMVVFVPQTSTAYFANLMLFCIIVDMMRSSAKWTSAVPLWLSNGLPYLVQQQQQGHHSKCHRPCVILGAMQWPLHN